jgi:hypothetical protein
MEQTAVEWLIDQLFKLRYPTLNQIEIMEQAKEMEQKQKQEIRRTSYMEGYDEGLHDALNK